VEQTGGSVILRGSGPTFELPGRVHSLVADGDAFAVSRLRPPGLAVLVGADALDRPLHRIEVPNLANLGMRRQGATVTLWSDEGHVVAIDSSSRQLMANLHVRP